MSAGYIVDLGNTIYSYSIATSVAPDSSPSSGVRISRTADMLHADSFTSLMVAIDNSNCSGQIQFAVQTSDTDISGNFTDPTSGLSQFPTVFASGGVVWFNSGGLLGGVFGPFTSGQTMTTGSGGGAVAFAGFQRPHRYVRAVVLSGAIGYAGTYALGFVGQFRTTGSGGGQSQQPGSGTVNV